jgi:hypothetical protein
LPERSMNILEKRDLIQSLNTAQLVKDIHQGEADLQKIMEEDLHFRSSQQENIPGRADDTAAIKKIEAELFMQVPAEIKTVDAKKAWLLQQREVNPDLKKAIQNQRMAEFTASDFEIKKEMTRKKLDNLKAILSLRCAQIMFFAGDVRTTIPLEEEIKEETH